MEPINDANSLLDFSSTTFNLINKLYSESVYEEDLPPTLNILIKNYLENIRSSLDYIANYIFDTYCSSEYNPKDLESIKRSIYFPICKNEKKFNQIINKKFKGLSKEFVDILEKYQPYKNNQWIKNLHEISNKSKHIELIKNTRVESGKVNYLVDKNNNQLINVKFENCSHAIVIDGVALTNKNTMNFPNIVNYDGDIKAEYYFKITNTPIISTLNDILSGSKSILDDFKKVL